MANPSDEIVDLILKLLAVREVREKPMEAALGVHLRRTKISSPCETFEADLPSGPFDKVVFWINKETNRANIGFRPREGSPPLYESQLDFSRLAKKPDAYQLNIHVPPEGTDTVFYGPEEKCTSFTYTAKTKRFLGASIEWR
jgi:hypothetical protein